MGHWLISKIRGTSYEAGCGYQYGSCYWLSGKEKKPSTSKRGKQIKIFGRHHLGEPDIE